MDAHSHAHLPEDALVNPEIQGIICTLTSDDRPIKGTAAILDWRLRGVISRFIKAGQITGTKGEIVFIPAQKLGQNKCLLLVGVGRAQEPLLPSEIKALLDEAQVQILNLGLTRVAVSLSSFAVLKQEDLARSFKNLNVTFIQ